VLQQHARGNIGGSARRFRDGLVVLQVAATLVLLVGAGLMLRTLANLNAIELGFDARQSADDAGGAAAGEVSEAARRMAFFDRVSARSDASRRCKARVWIDAAISGHGQHAILLPSRAGSPSR
jgi:hypothetical protein